MSATTPHDAAEQSRRPRRRGRRSDTRRQRPDAEVQALHSAISRLPLADEGKRALHARYLGQLGWMEDNARRSRLLHSLLRLTAIVAGVTVPALVSLDLRDGAGSAVRWATFGISLTAAISAAIDEFFSYGDKWRHFRRIAETLKSEGWSFVQLSGPYRGGTHAELVTTFADAVERISQEESATYLTTIATERDARSRAGDQS